MGFGASRVFKVLGFRASGRAAIPLTKVSCQGAFRVQRALEPCERIIWIPSPSPMLSVLNLLYDRYQDS